MTVYRCRGHKPPSFIIGTQPDVHMYTHRSQENALRKSSEQIGDD